MRHLLFWQLVISLVLGLTGCNSDDKIETARVEESYTIVVMPDTQKYSRYNLERYLAQTQWIADNYEQENIVFTAHLGDVVDRAGSGQEWINAKEAMSILDANSQTPYSILAGNHDVLDSNKLDSERDLTAEPFLKHFSPSLHQNNFASFKGSDLTGFNSYHIFKAVRGNIYY